MAAKGVPVLGFVCRLGDLYRALYPSDFRCLGQHSKRISLAVGSLILSMLWISSSALAQGQRARSEGPLPIQVEPCCPELKLLSKTNRQAPCLKPSLPTPAPIWPRKS